MGYFMIYWHCILTSAEKFLFADLNHAAVGQPLMYTTRFYLPRRKCLKFAYFMNGEGVGSLAVNLRQGDSLFVEIFKLVGNQGDSWKEANVPLDTLSLNAIIPFRVSSNFRIYDITFLPCQQNFLGTRTPLTFVTIA